MDFQEIEVFNIILFSPKQISKVVLTVRLIEKVQTDFCNRIINEGKDVKCFGPLYLIFEQPIYVITAFSFSTINSHRISMQL